MMCEKCWTDAYDPYGDQVENYRKLLKARKDNPCTPKEQAGQWWDEDRQCDSRIEKQGTTNQSRPHIAFVESD